MEGDLPEYRLQKGAISTIVEYYPMPEGEEGGYSLEGLIYQDTIEVAESQISQYQTPDVKIDKSKNTCPKYQIQ